jgi:hypothetical protein
LITWALAASYYPADFNNWPVVAYGMVAAAITMMLFVSVLFHELGLAVIARPPRFPCAASP